MEDDEYSISQKAYMIYMHERARANYRVKFGDIESANNFYCGIWTYFGVPAIMDIWKPPYQQHIINKWEKCIYNNGNVDVQRFYNGLDEGNKKLLISWYNNKMNTII